MLDKGMLKITSSELSKVVKLAGDLYTSKENYSKSDAPPYFKEAFLDEDSMSPEIRDLTKKEIKLLNYLDSLNIDALKDLIAIMYLGRDKDYNKQETARIIIKNQRADFENLIGSNRDGMVSTLLEKRLLKDYLKQGIEILGISKVN